jgi:hypothetical protein
VVDMVTAGDDATKGNLDYKAKAKDKDEGG